jgi:hypothetical protein
MVTMSPLTDNQFVVAVRSGRLSSGDQYAYLLEHGYDGPGKKRLPPSSEIQQACARDPVLAAQYFDKMSKFFIEKVLGWDLKSHSPVDGGGLFGIPCAFAGGIETQGCSTLHFHMLLWMENMPHTATEEQNINDQGNNESDAAANQAPIVPSYDDMLCVFLDSIATTELPMYSFFRHFNALETEVGVTSAFRLLCPLCGNPMNGKKEAPLLNRTDKAKFPPELAKCHSCQKTYSHLSLRKEYLSIIAALTGKSIEDMYTAARHMSEEPNFIETPKTLSREHMDIVVAEILRFIAYRKGGRIGDFTWSQHDDILRKDVQRAAIYSICVLTVQEHKFEHHLSCFKKGRLQGCRFKYCRYCYPRDHKENTSVSRNSMEIKRLPSCAYINAYSDVLFSLCKSNCDISLMRSLNLGYAIKYAAKVQQDIDSEALFKTFKDNIKRSFMRNQMRESVPGYNKSDRAKGDSRLFSLLYHFTNMQEIASTMAALYLLRQSQPMYESHMVVSLNLNNALAQIDGGEQIFNVREAADSNNNYVGLSAYACYTNRPLHEVFNNVSWYSYQRNYEEQTHNSCANNASSFSLPESHPKHNTRKVRKRCHEAVVQIIGPSLLPRERRENQPEKEEAYCKYAMILFLPHRDKNELKPDGITWKQAFDNAILSKSLCIYAKEYLDYNEDMWRATIQRQEDSKAYRDNMLEEDKKLRAQVGDDDNTFDDDTEVAQQDDVEEEDDILNDNCISEYVPINDSAFDTLDYVMSEEDVVMPPANIPSVIIPRFEGYLTLEQGMKGPNAAQGETDEMGYNDEINHAPVLVLKDMTVTIIKNIYNSAIDCPSKWFVEDNCNVEEVRASINAHTSIRLEELSKSNQDKIVENEAPTVSVTYKANEPNIDIPIFSSLIEICALFDLNCEQRRAFYISGKALLTAYYNDDNDTCDYETHDDQSFLFIHGLGGSGKSVFIRALLALATSWLRPGSVLTCAPTGVAAVNVAGYTLASLIGKRISFFDKVT